MCVFLFQACADPVALACLVDLRALREFAHTMLDNTQRCMYWAVCCHSVHDM